MGKIQFALEDHVGKSEGRTFNVVAGNWCTNYNTEDSLAETMKKTVKDLDGFVADIGPSFTVPQDHGEDSGIPDIKGNFNGTKGISPCIFNYCSHFINGMFCNYYPS